MMQPVDPRYPSQAQLYPPPPGTLGYYPQPVAPSAAALDLLPNQPQQGPEARNFLSRGLCCFQGSTYTRYGSIILAILAIIHAIASIAIASAAEAEVRGTKIKANKGNFLRVDNAPTFTFYGSYVSVIGRIVIESWEELGLLQAILLTIILEILPGGVLIAAALVLKEFLCIVAAVPFGLLFLVNAIEFIFIPISMVRIGPVDSGAGYEEDGDILFVKFTVLGMLSRFIFCAGAIGSMNAAIGLKRQIRKGAYNVNWQQTVAVPVPMVYAGPQVETVVGEQTYSAAGTTVAREEPAMESSS